MADLRARMQAIPARLIGLFASRRDHQRHGRAVRWLLTRAGRDPDRLQYAAECRQCGEWRSVTLLRLGRHRVRYWCQRCGAEVSLRQRTALRPIAELRGAASDAGASPPGPGTPGPATSDLNPREVIPAAMLRWATGRYPKRVARLDKSSTYQLYRAWDAHLERLPAGQLAGLAVAGEPPPVPGLPPFSTVVGALNDACYRSELVVDLLAGSIQPRSGVNPATAALWARTEHARRWLASRGGELCWIHSRVPSGGQVTPSHGEVRAAIAALQAGERAGSKERVIRAAVFGTDGGPPLGVLLAAHPTEEMIAALEAYLASRARPLREQALARLTAPLATLPDDSYGHRR